MRDSDETRLLQRLTTVLKQYPAPAQPAKPSTTQGQEKVPYQEIGFCQKHQVEMTLNTKDGRQWWAHVDQAAGKWCKGQ